MKLYNDRRWKEASRLFLHHNPLCVACQKQDRITAATVTDHITPHKGNAELFWDSDNNWAALCASCHGAKSASERKQPPGD